MSDFGLFFQIGGGLLVLFFIFLTWQNTKTWAWQHVTLTFLVFAASLVFCVYAAQAVKTRTTWLKLHDRLAKQAADLQEQVDRATHGDINDVEGKNPSVISLREALARTVLDRGRVWRQCMPQQANPDGSVTLATSPPPDPANPNPPAARKNNMAPKLIVYAFREGQQNPDSPVLPVFYIGEFQVINATDNAVTLAPTMPLSQEQFAAGRGATWSLYETCPIDGHEWFAGVEEAQLRAMLPQQLVPPAVIESYVRDGKEATDRDPPENVWFEVKFDKEYEVVVDAPPVNALDAGPFNTEGQAVLPPLRRGGETPDQAGKVTYGPKEGQVQTALLDQQTATSLIDQGICTLVKKVYRRRLTDYDRALHAINERINELNGRLRALTADNQAMLAATEKAEKQRALVEELKGKATADMAKVQHEVAELQKYQTAMQQQLLAVQTELSELYRSNKAISRALAARTAELTDEINRRTREATAMSPR
jgi:hypothetical protein